MKFLETEIGADRQIKVMCIDSEHVYGAFRINDCQLEPIYLDFVNGISNHDRRIKMGIDNLIMKTICKETDCKVRPSILASELDRYIRLAFQSQGLSICPKDPADEPKVHRSPLAQPAVPANDNVEPNQRPAI